MNITTKKKWRKKQNNIIWNKNKFLVINSIVWPSKYGLTWNLFSNKTKAKYWIMIALLFSTWKIYQLEKKDVQQNIKYKCIIIILLLL